VGRKFCDVGALILTSSAENKYEIGLSLKFSDFEKGARAPLVSRTPSGYL